MRHASTLSRRGLLAAGAGLGLSAVCAPARAEEALVVVELFSSQGCSSCPPADNFLTELRNLPRVLALTFHVDYWDYLGWKDTLAAPEFSQRQYDYAKARGDMDVYTPQLIVNGERHFVGSQRDQVKAAIAAAHRTPLPVAMTLGRDKKEVVIEVGAGEAGVEGTVWLMPVMPNMRSKILKGEIAGMEIDYVNVVRKILPVGMWTGDAARFVLPVDGVIPPDCTSCVALLQTGKVGRILGAAAWGEIGS